jgi:HK97 family phage portal protein
MAFFDFLRTKASAASRTFVTNPNQPRWTPRDYTALAREGYRMNVVGYQAVNRVADAIATIEWEVWKDDKPIEGPHPLKDLWDRPNPQQSRSEFLRANVGFMLLSGNGYTEAAEGVRGRPTELYALRSDRMKLIPNAEGQVERYVYTNNGKKVRWDVDPITGNGPILHMKMFNPLDDFYGMSPIEAGAFAIDQHNESMKWMQALLQNSARPSGALVLKEGANIGDEQFSRLQGQIEEQYSGSANAGRPMLLENGLTWQAMGFSPQDMSNLETKYSSARDVCLAFGVPPQLLGIPGDNTYSNYKEARLAFYEDTIIPLLSQVLGSYNPWFAEPFDGAYLVPDLDKIPAIAEKRQEKWDMIDKSRELTINERREAKGYAPIETVVPTENGNRLLGPERAEAAVNTAEGKALMARLGYGS